MESKQATAPALFYIVVFVVIVGMGLLGAPAAAALAKRQKSA